MFCYQNQITSLDLTQNIHLDGLWAYDNPLTSINVTQNPELTDILVQQSLLTEIDVTNNLNLQYLYLNNMKLTSLDVSQNPLLLQLYTENNELVSVNIKNGSNINIENVVFFNNQELECIQVDDETYANSQMCDLPYYGWCKDETASYSEDCQLGSENFTIADFQLFPNPTGNILNIEIQENIESVKIYSTQGILVKDVFSKIVDVSQLSAGMYFVRVSVGGKSFTKKFIKQ